MCRAALVPTLPLSDRLQTQAQNLDKNSLIGSFLSYFPFVFDESDGLLRRAMSLLGQSCPCRTACTVRPQGSWGARKEVRTPDPQIPPAEALPSVLVVDTVLTRPGCVEVRRIATPPSL